MSVPTPLITRSAVCTQHITSLFPRSTACLTRDSVLALLSYTDDIYTVMTTSHGSAKGTGATQKSEK